MPNGDGEANQTVPTFQEICQQRKQHLEAAELSGPRQMWTSDILLIVPVQQHCLTL